MELFAFKRKHRDLQYNPAVESADFMKLDAIWGEFEALVNAEAEETKRVVYLLGIKEALTKVFIQLKGQSVMTYDEL